MRNSDSEAGPRNRGTVSDARKLEESFAIRMQDAPTNVRGTAPLAERDALSVEGSLVIRSF